MNKHMDSVLQISELSFEMHGFYEDIFLNMQDMVRVINDDMAILGIEFL